MTDDARKPCQACEDAAKTAESYISELFTGAPGVTHLQVVANRIRSSCRHAQPAASAEDVREDLNSALSYCGGAMQYASHHCQNIVGDISAIRQQIERALSKINAAPQVNGLQIDRVWIDEHPESGAAPGLPEEPFWWWASGSVSRHEPDRDYEVVEKRDYDKLRAHADALQSRLSAAYALLSIAACPACGGSGAIPHQISDDEYEAEQCQWCFERNATIAIADKERK